jgi:hypothetical protein
MFPNKQGFERVTQDEATGAVTGMALTFIGGVIYLGVEEGNPFAHNAYKQELQPNNAAANHSHKPSQGTAIEVLGGPALLGAVVGVAVTSGVRRVAHRRAAS